VKRAKNKKASPAAPWGVHLYTVTEAAERLGVSRWFLYDRMKRGLLPYVQSPEVAARVEWLLAEAARGSVLTREELVGKLSRAVRSLPDDAMALTEANPAIMTLCKMQGWNAPEKVEVAAEVTLTNSEHIKKALSAAGATLAKLKTEPTGE